MHSSTGRPGLGVLAAGGALHAMALRTNCRLPTERLGRTAAALPPTIPTSPTCDRRGLARARRSRRVPERCAAGHGASVVVGADVAPRPPRARHDTGRRRARGTDTHPPSLADEKLDLALWC
ncbi:hypothetical protein CDD83_10694 [Cordyceps sp. RAO-2017]|nr:hypothetical protein CDD83_10694 [Cordyceps sp. RAO-2017]